MRDSLKKKPTQSFQKNKLQIKESNNKEGFYEEGVTRIKTGIGGFDKLVQGGFPILSNTLVCGTFGTGKTIFGLEFIYRGITEYNENGIIISFEVRKEDLIQQAKMFGWYLEELEKQKKLKILCYDVLKINNLMFEEIKRVSSEINAKRMLFDSLSEVSLNMGKNIHVDKSPDTYSIQQFVYYLVHKLRELKTTNIFISDTLGAEDYTKDTVSEFICDNIVQLKFQTMGGPYSRILLVRKARSTKNNEDIHPLEIGKTGMVVHDLT
jgi:KaiC/GvpD/RAD55 family RecA-like ATPase